MNPWCGNLAAQAEAIWPQEEPIFARPAVAGHDQHYVLAREVGLLHVRSKRRGRAEHPRRRHPEALLPSVWNRSTSRGRAGSSLGTQTPSTVQPPRLTIA